MRQIIIAVLTLGILSGCSGIVAVGESVAEKYCRGLDSPAIDPIRDKVVLVDLVKRYDWPNVNKVNGFPTPEEAQAIRDFLKLSEDCEDYRKRASRLSGAVFTKDEIIVRAIYKKWLFQLTNGEIRYEDFNKSFSRVIEKDIFLTADMDRYDYSSKIDSVVDKLRHFARLEEKSWEFSRVKQRQNETVADVPKEQFSSYLLSIRYLPAELRPKDVAVIIGNANYNKLGKDIPDVIPAYADAEGMRLYVTQALGVSKDNIIFLKDATQTDMVGTFGNKDNYKGRLFRYLTPNKSRVFVFYSGHGAPGDGGVNYLVPTDAEASLIDLNGYSLKTLYSNLSKLSAKSVTVVLEACFSGASEAGAVINNASSVYLKAKGTSIPSNITVISAGTANQIASWEQDKSHGLFTKHFLKGMNGEADNDNDRKVSWTELRDYLAKTVTRSAMRNYGREQTPQIVVGSGG
jgi:hypothetical protein